MAYVTADEYKEALHLTDAPKDFDTLEAKAEGYLDDITRDFYRKHELESDRFALRASRFKHAMMRQIEYMSETGLTSADDAAKQPSSVTQTIGRTTVTKQFSGATGAGSNAASIISADALAALSGTGLLYGGIAYVRS